jgi:serine/threonine protein phosphatase PrpC
MKIEVGVATDIGRVRDGNEDSFLVVVDPPLFAVADGMGGHRGGEVASHLALETVEELAGQGEGTLADQVREANRAVFAKSQDDRSVNGMGTTLTAAKVLDDTVLLAHVGDSRAYLLRAGAMRQLTDDHTLVNRMLKAGEITAGEAGVHPHRNVLTRALGTEPEVKVDTDEVALMDGDRMLLCSDGLFGMLTEDQIQAICEAEPDPQKAADKLVRAANRAGGVDNITVLVLDAHQEPGGVSSAATVSGGIDASAERPRRVWRWLASAGVVVLVLVAAWSILHAYIDRQWYVGESGGKVAIYQGVPAAPLGLNLSHVVVVTDLSAADVTQLELYKNLPEGISANSQSDAQSIVDQMTKDVIAAKGHKSGAASGGGSG